MSKYYNPIRKRNLYEPGVKESFRISRSKIDDFLKCPRCFYIDRRLGRAHPPGYPFSLNRAVDELLKNEFDEYRAKGKAHPVMQQHSIDAIPFKHEKIDHWRDSLKGGIEYLHAKTNLFITGGVDDVWVTPQDELIIVDYKATSKKEEVTIDEDWQESYKRQMEVYQWLFRRNDFKVHPVGYFLYCNGDATKSEFNCKLEFEVTLIPYEGDDSWVEQTVLDIYACLNSDKLPSSGTDCDFCKYRTVVSEVED